MDLLDVLSRARHQGDPTLLVEAIPYARFLGLHASLDAGKILCRLDFSDRIVGNPALPAIHGGALGALLESTALFQLLWSHEAPAFPKTITLTIDYLRSARPVATFARADVTRLGRRVATLHVTAWQDDPARPVATANVHGLLPELP